MPETRERPQSSRSIPAVGAKRQPFGLFPREAPRLFVPHPDMWLVHEASKPVAVAKRAKIHERSFAYWTRHYKARAPWLADWLYGGDLPPEAAGFPLTEDMHAFRAETSITSLSAATERPLEEVWVGPRQRKHAHAPRQLISAWLSQYRNAPWFARWLIRGENAPPEIRTVTPDEVRRCSRAWDFVRLCKDAGISSYLNNYYIWFNRPPKVLPDGKDRLAWLKWLYRDAGYRRAPDYVVLPDLQSYRRRGTVMAIAEAAHVSLGAVRGWLRKPELKSLLREAVLAARKGKSPESDGFKQLDRRMRECMLLYAKASTKAARCKDENVDIKPQQLDQLLQEAAGRGVKEDLLQYLNYKGPYRAISFRKQHGLINGKLFVIPPAMCRFHDVAVKEWHRQNLAELERLPGFDAWFAAWVTPAIHDGQAPSAPVELDQHRPIVNHPAETQTTTADSKSGITDRQRLILETMLDMDIASEASKEPQSVILRKINPNLDTNNYKRAFAGLHKRGLIDSIKGPDGGVWLTDEGKREAVLD